MRRSYLRRVLVLLAVLALGTASTLPAQWTWQQRRPPTSPPSVMGITAYSTMVYDSARSKIVLFGLDGVAQSFDQVWEWDGATWQRPPVSSAPSYRRDTAVAFDSRRGRAVLFGGRGPGAAHLGDTWEWDGQAWIQRFPLTSPSARSGHAMCFDSVRGVTVLHDGVGDGDTWEWDGNNWSKRHQSASDPVPRNNHQLVFDAGRGKCALLGGLLEWFYPLRDWWEWDGSSWVLNQAGELPFVDGRFLATYDVARRSIVLVDETGTWMRVNDRWGDRWVRTVVPEKTPTDLGRIAYDAARDRVVAAGRDSAGSFTTWELVPVPAYRTFGTGCVGTYGTPELLTPSDPFPTVGFPFSVEVTNLPPSGVAYMVVGLSKTDWFGVPLPLALDFLQMTGCSAYTDHLRVFPIVSVGGRAVWTTLVWNDVGRTFYNQVYVLDPGANPFGLIVSNAGEGTIGR